MLEEVVFQVTVDMIKTRSSYLIPKSWDEECDLFMILRVKANRHKNTEPY